MSSFESLTMAGGRTGGAPAERMTIYDVLRHLVNAADWARPGEGDVDQRERRAAATKLIDRLEEQGLLGQTALNVKENI